jgi:hypothetical protein
VIRSASILAPLFLGALACSGPTWAPDFHRLIAETAFRDASLDSLEETTPAEWDRVFRDVRRHPGPLVLPRWTVGQLCSLYAADGSSPARFHESGRSIREELRALGSSAIDGAWSAARRSLETGPTVRDLLQDRPLDVSARPNVVQNFLLHHMVALRLAAADTSRPAAWSLALAFEAAALGYLADAFDSGRLLIPKARGPFLWLSRSRADAIRHYSDAGVYVMNSRGQVWQAIGEVHTEWFHTPLFRVLDAARTAVRELLLVRHRADPDADLPPSVEAWARAVAPDGNVEEMVRSWLAPASGESIYVRTKLPSLLCLPMPISATWRVKVDPADELGVRPARHYPQLRSPGLHDPTLATHERPFLYSEDAMPPWLVPRFIAQRGPEAVIREDRDVASVRFVQRPSVPPSWAGLSVSGEYGLRLRNTDVMPAYGAGLGYGARATAGASAIWLLPRATYHFRYHSSGRRLFALSTALGFGSRVSSPVIDLALGFAWGDRARFLQKGPTLAVGYYPGTLSTGVLYAGLSSRLKIEAAFLETVLWGVSVELSLH